MDIREINYAIMFGSLTNVELNSIIDAVQFARKNIQRQNIVSLSIGRRVKWTSSKNPHGEQGVVEKIARKFVTVRTDAGSLWRVPANMLAVAEV